VYLEVASPVNDNVPSESYKTGSAFLGDYSTSEAYIALSWSNRVEKYDIGAATNDAEAEIHG
jgi:hypothetical protein